MLRAQWGKFMKNTGINQATAVLGAPYGLFHREGPARDLMLMVAAEVVEISKRRGVNLDESDLKEFVTNVNGLHSDYKTSMLQDIEAGTRLIIILLVGSSCHEAAEYDKMEINKAK